MNNSTMFVPAWPTWLVRVGRLAMASLVCFLGSVFGAISASQESPTTTVSNQAWPLPVEKGTTTPATLFTDLCTNPATGGVYWSAEDCGDTSSSKLAEDSQIVDRGKWIYPEAYPLSINLVRMDGGKLHCQPWATPALLATDGGVTINGQLVEAWTAHEESDGFDGLKILPADNGLKYQQVVIVVGDTRVAWLPNGAATMGFNLGKSSWADNGIFPARIQLCLAKYTG